MGRRDSLQKKTYKISPYPLPTLLTPGPPNTHPVSMAVFNEIEAILVSVACLLPLVLSSHWHCECTAKEEKAGETYSQARYLVHTDDMRVTAVSITMHLG